MRAKCGPCELLLWPASEFLVPKLEFNIASKLKFMVANIQTVHVEKSSFLSVVLYPDFPQDKSGILR